MSTHNCDDNSEEFNNFMHRVNEVSSIVNKLASKDKKIQEIGDIEARRYLGEDNSEKIKELETLKEDDVEITIRSNRTVLNKTALHKDENPATQSQESFMAEVEKDADQRYKDKLRRTERMQTLKKQANLAFKRDEFEKALTLYTKALEQIRDSITLYLNRALTFIHLKLYENALDDLHWALRLNENSIKAWLLTAKAHYYLDNQKEFQTAIKEANERNPEHSDFIKDFIEKLQLTNKDDNL